MKLERGFFPSSSARNESRSTAVPGTAIAATPYMLVPNLGIVERRALGKQLNNSMLFGLTPNGVRDLAVKVLGREPRDGTGHAVWSAWWARYAKLAAFRDKVFGLVRRAQYERCGLHIRSPSGRLSKYSPAEIQGRVGRGRRAPGPDGIWRTVFSACFRSVEGDLLDATLRNFHAESGGGRPVLPMYDGLIAAGPTDAVEFAQHALLAAAEAAIRDLGIPKLRPEIKLRERDRRDETERR
ncbi:MAG: hypothetical protein HYV07_14030 [Deltaproteobacteria bacterium]|nr:hypothetical protein [Deltaproteobacteria bacterium]